MVRSDKARNGRVVTPAAARFWQKVDRKGADECWPWIAARTGFGHGKIWDFGVLRGAHCVSYEMHAGPIPKGLLVRHTCDNPWCVNPKHLVAGTHKDNGRDMVERGRNWMGDRMKGEAHPNSKINKAMVRRILKDPRSSLQLAKHVGISASVIRKIRQGNAWAHVPRAKMETK